MTPGAGGQNSFEALVVCGAEAACFDAAFFRYLKHNAPADADGPMIIRSWPEGGFERKLVVLWSGAAAAEFARFWRRYASDDVSLAPGRVRPAHACGLAIDDEA